MKQHDPKPLPHARKSTIRISYVVCRHCGLVWLRNKATELAKRKTCPGLEDPQGFEGWN